MTNTAKALANDMRLDIGSSYGFDDCHSTQNYTQTKIKTRSKRMVHHSLDARCQVPWIIFLCSETQLLFSIGHFQQPDAFISRKAHAIQTFSNLLFF
jgi:hypothetical protein